jgi:Flp pilus assembly protein TadD
VRNRNRPKHRKWRKRDAAELAARRLRTDEFQIHESAQQLPTEEEEYNHPKPFEISRETEQGEALEADSRTSGTDLETADSESSVEYVEPTGPGDDPVAGEAETVAVDDGVDTRSAHSTPAPDESEVTVPEAVVGEDESPLDSTGSTAHGESGSEVRPEELFGSDSVAASTGWPPEPATEELLERAAREAAERDEIQRATSIYEELLRISPNNVKARNNLALLLDREGDREGALEALDRCLNDDPDCVQAKINRGAILASLARYGEAERDLLAAVRQDSGNAEGHFNLGLLSIRKGLWADAVPYLRRSIELDASRSSAHYYLGEALNHVDDLQGAMQSYQRAAELQPTNPEALYGLGIVLDRLNRPDDAAQMYRRSRELAGR